MQNGSYEESTTDTKMTEMNVQKHAEKNFFINKNKFSLESWDSFPNLATKVYILL